MSRTIQYVLLAMIGCLGALKLGAFSLSFFPHPIGPRAEYLVQGCLTTLLLSLLAGVIGLLFGLFCALGQLSSFKILRWLITGYSLVFRGTPVLAQILFCYYALPVLAPSFKLGEFSSAALALSLNVGAYNAEIIRAGILSVPRGQIEAARSLGLSYRQALRWVVIPQAFRMMTPALLNNFVALLKDSSIASSIGVLELSLVGQRISSETFQPLPVFTTIATIYLFMTALTLVITRLTGQKLNLLGASQRLDSEHLHV